MRETERLYAYRGDEPTTYPTLTLELRGLPDPEQGLACPREIMRDVLAVPEPLWHEDAAADWAAYLPAWFVESMRRFAPAEILARPEQWEYASWVATMVGGLDGTARVWWHEKL